MSRIVLLILLCPVAALAAKKNNGFFCTSNGQCKSNNCVSGLWKKTGGGVKKVCAVAGRKCGKASHSSGGMPQGSIATLTGDHRRPVIDGTTKHATHAKCAANGWQYKLKNGIPCAGYHTCLSTKCQSTGRYQNWNSHNSAKLDGYNYYCKAGGKHCPVPGGSGARAGDKRTFSGAQHTCFPTGKWVRNHPDPGESCTHDGQCPTGKCRTSPDGAKVCAPGNNCALTGNAGKPNNHVLDIFTSRYTCKSGVWKGHRDAACRSGVPCMPGHACVNGKCNRVRRGNNAHN